MKDCLEAGFRKEDLVPVSLALSAANKSPIKIAGAVIARLKATLPDGRETSCATMIYVSPSAEGLYLSLETMIDLGLIPFGSPLAPDQKQPQNGRVIAIETESIGQDSNPLSETSSAVPGCSCPQRTAVPPRPESLPFPVSPENKTKMKDWLFLWVF